jgi:hypothetical protein
MTRYFSAPRFARFGLALTIAASLSLTIAQAKPIMPMDAPIPRLLANVSEYVKQNPRDPNGFYTLGRIHYYAFAAPTRQTMPVTRYSPEGDKGTLPSAVPFGNPGHIPDDSRKGEGKALSPAERKAHIQAAIRNLQQAIALVQKSPADTLQKGLAELTLACVYEEGKADASKTWREEAIRFYRLAYDRSLQSDNKRTNAPIFGIQTLVYHEAAQSYLRLVKQRGIRLDEKKKVVEVETTARRLASLPRSNVVTPIVFPLDQARPLASLIAPQPQGMAFDLDGSARTGQRYSAWPRKDTGILVWDPTHTGRITSGRQLFGSATWWIFWENGYRALQSLDDNGDGWLTGNELRSLGVWTDRSNNGKCEPDEVRPITEMGIAGLNARGSRPTREGWECKEGIRLQDGRILPTYDWLAETIPMKG